MIRSGEGNGGETAGLRGGKGKRKAGRAGAEAAAGPVRQPPPLPGPPSRAPPRLRPRERARACPACAPPPPAEPGASASCACNPARAWVGEGAGRTRDAPRPPAFSGLRLLTCIPGERAVGRARPRAQAALGRARVPPSREKMPTEAAAGGGEEAASALQTSQEFRTLRPGSGMPLRPTPSLNPGARSLQRPAPAFRNDGRSHHKHSRLSHDFKPTPHPFRGAAAFPHRNAPKINLLKAITVSSFNSLIISFTQQLSFQILNSSTILY